MTQFRWMAAALGASLLIAGCGTLTPVEPVGLPSHDFGEMGPPAYQEAPPDKAPDLIMLPSPDERPAPQPQPTPQPDPWTPLPYPTQPTPAPTQPTPAPTQPTPAPITDSEYLSQLEEAILQMVNAERSKVGAKALAMETLRRDVSRAHSKDMAVRNFFSHTNPDGQSPFDRMKAVGITYTTAGENIAYNTYPVDRAAKAAMDGWMNSDGHRKNLLNTRYGRTGIGVYRNPSNGRVYFTQVFTN